MKKVLKYDIISNAKLLYDESRLIHFNRWCYAIGGGVGSRRLPVVLVCCLSGVGSSLMSFLSNLSNRSSISCQYAAFPLDDRLPHLSKWLEVPQELIVKMC